MNVARDLEPATRVVIIDDTEDLRELLRFALERAGMEVIGEAADGRAGIEVVGVDPPDLVLLDLSMPVMDGLEALPHVRRLAPHARIVVLSGFEAGQMADRALATGADGYLQKGMPLARIVERLREIIGDGDGDQADAAVPERPPLRVAPEPVEPEQAEAPLAEAHDLLAAAPFGVVVLADVPPYDVQWSNAATAGILGRAPAVGRPLEEASQELARLVSAHDGTARERFTAPLPDGPTGVVVRRLDDRLAVYLEPAAHDVGTLRRTMATTAHELRGPVSVLVALAETIDLHDGHLDEAARSRLMSSVARQARLLDGVTGDLLVAAQLDRGALQLQPEPLDPVTVVRAVLADHTASADLWVEHRGRLLADPLRLEQMVSNLVRNAVRHGRAPLTVTVRANPLDPSLVDIEVADSGAGVPEEFRDRLFDEFARADGAAVGGVGLGLHVVRSLAEAHGGAVGHRPGDDGGAVFTLSLPGAD